LRPTSYLLFEKIPCSIFREDTFLSGRAIKAHSEFIRNLAPAVPIFIEHFPASSFVHKPVSMARIIPWGPGPSILGKAMQIFSRTSNTKSSQSLQLTWTPGETHRRPSMAIGLETPLDKLFRKMEKRKSIHYQHPDLGPALSPFLSPSSEIPTGEGSWQN
jgi:hypothetical protein